MRKPMPLIFSEFMGTHYELSEHFKTDGEWAVSGDVKYHLGSSMDRTYPDGRKIHLSLVANPSHLECVNAVVVGKARAKQYYCGNRPEDVRNVVPILLHGDAAFAGQGIVYETMQMAGVDDFNVGGTIHVIVNNQIGFTTNPIHSRSTPYCLTLGRPSTALSFIATETTLLQFRQPSKRQWNIVMNGAQMSLSIWSATDVMGTTN
ncbi:Dehydrogenase E1 component [Fragilaria crotonensis]|nr:Dehydrogenase E1 component [Fragilaria crotonensis]